MEASDDLWSLLAAAAYGQSPGRGSWEASRMPARSEQAAWLHRGELWLAEVGASLN